MQLNKQLPGLPDWPAISAVGNTGEIVVRGDHIPYGTLFFFQALFPFLPAKLICQLFFKKWTVVRFTPTRVMIGNKAYDIANGVAIQFRANRPHMKETQYKALERHLAAGTLGRPAALRLQFRKVEMIYGARIVDITSIEDPDRAQQFAIALQAAYELATSRQTNSAPPPMPRTGHVHDALPE
jgi:hypothetical protein